MAHSTLERVGHVPARVVIINNANGNADGGDGDEGSAINTHSSNSFSSPHCSTTCRVEVVRENMRSLRRLLSSSMAPEGGGGEGFRAMAPADGLFGLFGLFGL